MKPDELLITEIFKSIQGETSLSGLPFAFVRLTGCNLRCTYCDSAYTFKGGERLRIYEVMEKLRPMQVEHVLVTGGEPLLQRNTPALVSALRDEGYQVSIETHGETSIEAVVAQARIVMDIKTPSSGMCRGGFGKNLPLLKETDEVKFVIASKEDYSWAKEVIFRHQLNKATTLLSPALPAEESPGDFREGVEPSWLAEQMLKDHLKVRFQLQLHKKIWGTNRKGV